MGVKSIWPIRGGMRLRNRFRYGSVTWRSVTHGWPIQSTLGNQVRRTRTKRRSRYSLMKLATADVIRGSVAPAVLLLMVNLILLMLGMFMEPLPIVLVLAPLLVPMMQSGGVDPVHLGVTMVLNLMVGLIHPPVGMNLFVVSAIGRVEVMQVFFQAIPYMILLLFLLVGVTYVPQLSLWLPNLIMGH